MEFQRTEEEQSTEEQRRSAGAGAAKNHKVEGEFQRRTGEED